MSIITLTTDWGNDGTYSGAMKGCLLSEIEDVKIIDISHKIKPYNMGHAAFVVRNTYSFYPKGTIHIIGVGGNLARNTLSPRFVLIEYEDYYFIGNDDGIWSLILDYIPDEVYAVEVTTEIHEKYGAFVELYAFSNIAKALLSGAKPLDIGHPYNKLQKSYVGLSTLKQDEINGKIIYIDDYGNCISNISRYEFNRVAKGRDLEIIAGTYKYTCDKINKTYNETNSGELLAIFSFSGLLEIAIANGSAEDLVGLNVDSTIRIKFYDNKHSKNEGQALLFG